MVPWGLRYLSFEPCSKFSYLRSQVCDAIAAAKTNWSTIIVPYFRLIWNVESNSAESVWNFEINLWFNKKKDSKLFLISVASLILLPDLKKCFYDGICMVPNSILINHMNHIICTTVQVVWNYWPQTTRRAFDSDWSFLSANQGQFFTLICVPHPQKL